MATLHISISAEPVVHFGHFVITNSLLASWVVTALLIILALIAGKTIKSTRRPQGLQNVLEMVVEALHSIVSDITQSPAKTTLFFPWFATFFLYIWLNNWLGLLPGVGTIGFYEGAPKKEASIIQTVHASEEVVADTHAATAETVAAEATAVSEAVAETPAAEDTTHAEPKFVPLLRAGTADINTTLALALISMSMVQFYGIKHLGLAYFKKFFNFSNAINAFVGILELVSEFAKVIAFTFRLFGNVFAGEVLLAVISFLLPVIAVIPFLGLEIFVGVIQAFIFSMLTLVFMNMATIGHGDEHDH